MEEFRCESYKLAAFLILRECKLIRIEPIENNLYVFYFKNKDGLCDKFTKQYTQLKHE